MKTFLSYTMKFIQSISFFLLSLGLILILTVFNEDYVLDLLDNHNYYQELYDNSIEEVSYYLEQSGLNEEVLKNVITVKSLKTSIITTIDNLYNNKKITVDTEEFQKNLTTNINNYIKDNNIRVDDKDTVNILTKKLVNIYEEEISYNNTFEKVRPLFNKAYKLTKIVLVISLITSIITYLINRYFFKDRNIIASLFTNFVILIGLVLYVRYTISISDIFFYNTSISNVLKEFINSVLKCMMVTGVVSFILGLLIVFIITGTFKALRENKKIFHTILVIIWMVIIFNFSSQNGPKSTKTSDVVTSMVVNVTTSVTNKDIPREEVKQRIEDSTFIVRKMAHFTEYLILGILVLQLLSDYTKINKRVLIISFLICYFYDISDEIHQIFIPGRTAKVLDTFIDGTGSLVGIILYSIYFNKCRKMSEISVR